jgi:membrane-associated HD superfamily phosphohydrolase
MMLADTIEATVRSAPDQSPESVASMLDKMFEARVIDGQLSECDLTLRDLQEIKQSLSTVLQGIYHPRGNYPSDDQLQEADQPPKLLEPSQS